MKNPIRLFIVCIMAMVIGLGMDAAVAAGADIFELVTPQPQKVEIGDKTVSFKSPGRALVFPALAELQSPTLPKLIKYLHSLGYDPVDIATMGHTDDNYDLVVILGPMDSNPEVEKYASLFPSLDSQLAGVENLEEANVLAVRNTDLTPMIWLGGVNPAGTFYALVTLEQILEPGPGPCELPELTVTDWPDFSFRGVLEGGMTSWDHPYRVHIMDIIGDMKFNFYLYAPKGDYKTRRRWRDQYTARELEQLEEVFTTAAENFVQVGYALNLALSVHFSDPEDFERIINRFKQVHELGAVHFGLFFDDSLPNLTNDADREAYGRVGVAQADLTNRVFETVRQWNPQAKFFFTPSLYWGFEDVQYFRDLGETLDPDINIGWTGDFIAAEAISDEDAQKIEAILGRKVGVGDNFWTNGFTPIVKRSPTLYKYVTGYITNSEWVSRICLDTTGDYTWNAEAYDSERSWRNAITKVSGVVRYPHMRAFLDAFEGRNQQDPATIQGPVRAAMDDLLASSGDGVLYASVALCDEINLMLEALEQFNDQVIHKDLHLIGQGGKPYADSKAHFAELLSLVEGLIEDYSDGIDPGQIVVKATEISGQYFK